MPAIELFLDRTHLFIYIMANLLDRTHLFIYIIANHMPNINIDNMKGFIIEDNFKNACLVSLF